MGGHFVQIVLRGQGMHRSPDAYEDLTGTLVPEAVPFGWAAVIRPDRTIMHDGSATEAARLIRESRSLLSPVSYGPRRIPPNLNNS